MLNFSILLLMILLLHGAKGSSVHDVVLGFPEDLGHFFVKLSLVNLLHALLKLLSKLTVLLDVFKVHLLCESSLFLGKFENRVGNLESLLPRLKFDAEIDNLHSEVDDVLETNIILNVDRVRDVGIQIATLLGLIEMRVEHEADILELHLSVVSKAELHGPNCGSIINLREKGVLSDILEDLLLNFPEESHTSAYFVLGFPSRIHGLEEHILSRKTHLFLEVLIVALEGSIHFLFSFSEEIKDDLLKGSEVRSLSEVSVSLDRILKVTLVKIGDSNVDNLDDNRLDLVVGGSSLIGGERVEKGALCEGDISVLEMLCSLSNSVFLK